MARKLDYDADNSGYLSRSELQTVFKTIFEEISKEEKYDLARRNKLFSIADLNSDNKLSFKQFIKIVEDFVQHT